MSECTPRPEEASRSSRKTPWWNLRRDASGLGKRANPRRNRAKPTRLHFAGGGSGPGAGSCRATVPRRRAGPPTAVASGALPRPPDPDPCAWCGAPISGETRTCRTRSLLSVARKPWRFFVPAALVVLLLTIVVPAARLALVVVVAVEAFAVAWYRWWNSSRQLQRRGLPPGQLAIPLFTSFLEDGFYRRQWNRYGPIYTTNTVSTPTVAVGGIELGRRILREHRDELRPPVFNHADRVEGGAVRNQVGERHRTSRAVFTRAFAPSTVEAARPAMEAAVRRHLATWLAESADFASPESPIRSRLELLVLDAWITVFLGVDPRTDVTLHARLVELFSRYSYLFPERRDPHDLAEQLAIIRERSLHPDELSASALRTLAERRTGSARRPGSDEQSRPHARHVTTRCRWAPHMACLPSGPPSPMVRPDTSGRRRRRARVLGGFRDDSPIPERECAPRDAVPSHHRGLHDPRGMVAAGPRARKPPRPRRFRRS